MYKDGKAGLRWELCYCNDIWAFAYCKVTWVLSKYKASFSIREEKIHFAKKASVQFYTPSYRYI